MATLNRDAILGQQDATAIRPVQVRVPEWGGELYVRTVSAYERDKWEERFSKKRKDKMENVRASLVILCACDENGSAVLRPDDVAALGKKSAAALNRVFDVACRLNGITGQDVEELEKNSEGGPQDGSPTV